MALTITNPTLANPASSTAVDENFADVVSKFDGNIVDADINTAAGITIGKFAQTYQEVWITFHYEFDVRAAWPAAPADPANLTVAEAEQAIIIPLPGANASTGWAPVSVGWVCTNAGTVAGSFGLRYGAWNAAGTICVSAGTIVSSQSITTTGADDTGVHSVATPTTT